MSEQIQRFYEFDGYRIETGERLLRRGETVISLQPKAVDLLLVLLENHGRVVSKEDLLAKVWENQFVEEANLSHTVFQLRKSLNGKNGEFIKTVSKRGYRFVADVKQGFDDEAETVVGEQTVTRISVEEEIEIADEPQKVIEAETLSPAIITTNQPSEEDKPRQIKRSKSALVVGLAVLLIAAIGFGFWFYAGRQADAEQVNSIAVLPFVNESGNADVEYLSDGMTETLISSLSQIPKLKVKARSSVFRYKGKDVSPQTVGTELNVQAILNGRVVQRGDELTLYLSLVDSKTENQIWGKQYNRKLNNLVALQTEIARDVSDNLKTKLTGADEQKLAKNYSKNAEAYRLYLKGVFYWNKFTGDSLKKAADYFQQAIDIDNNYALAYSGLANSYNVLGGNGHIPANEAFPKVKSAAEKAVALDDQLSEAHLALGAFKLFYEWDFLGAEQEFKRAIELDPNYAVPPELYGYILRAQGRFDEALVEMKKARELDPFALIIAGDIGETLRFAGQTAEAIEEHKKVLEMEPNLADARFNIGLAYAQHGMHETAVAEINRAIILSDNNTHIKAALGQVYAIAGKKAEAYKVIDELLAEAEQRNVSPLDIAMIYARLGDGDKAFVWLEKAYDERSGWMIELKVDPAWEKIRSDARFQDLLRRVGLEK